MMPFLYALAFLLLAVNIALGLPKLADFAQKKAFTGNEKKAVLSFSENLSQLSKGDVAGAQKSSRYPKNLGQPAPAVSATAVLAADLDSGFVFFAKDPDKRVPIASTTKMITALVASERFQLSDVLTVPDLSSVSGSTMGLKAGETLTLRSLLYGLLLNSGNDAAFTIAANYPGGASAFIDAMNKKADELKLTNTRFDNPAGFDSPGHFSSASDLAKIASLIPENVRLGRIVATKEAEVASVDRSVVHYLKNLNKLLDAPGVLGIKTGTTPLAKENLVGLIERDGHRVLTVVLGSNDRFNETEKLVDWVYSNFTWQ